MRKPSVANVTYTVEFDEFRKIMSLPSNETIDKITVDIHRIYIETTKVYTDGEK